MPIAPFQAIILSLNMKNTDVVNTSENIYQTLRGSGIEVLLDERDERPGIKFKDADLIGMPIHIIIGEKNLKEGKAEIKIRKSNKRIIVPVSDMEKQVRELIKELTPA